MNCDNPAYIRASGNVDYHYPYAQVKMDITPKQWFCLYGRQINRGLWWEDAKIENINPAQKGWFKVAKYNDVVKKMCDRTPIDSTFLDINPGDNRVEGHEGRHRAYAAYKLGIKKIPVTLFIERVTKVKGRNRYEKIPVESMTKKEKRNFDDMLRRCIFSPRYREEQE